MDPISTARYGMMQATQRFEASASKIASFGGDDSSVDLGQEMVGMIEAKEAFKANVTVVKFADQMFDALLKIQSDK